MVGTRLLHGDTNQQIYQSQYIVYHEKFDYKDKINDIALIRVAKDIQFNDKVQPTKLPAENLGGVGSSAVLTGWGRQQVNI